MKRYVIGSDEAYALVGVNKVRKKKKNRHKLVVKIMEILGGPGLYSGSYSIGMIVELSHPMGKTTVVTDGDVDWFRDVEVIES